MNATKMLVCILTAGAVLAAAAPAFADSDRGRGYGHDGGRYGNYAGRDHRNYNRDYGRDYRRGYYGRDYSRREFIVVQRPYLPPQAVYYAEPVPVFGVGAIAGAAIGAYIESRQ